MDFLPSPSTIGAGVESVLGWFADFARTSFAIIIASVALISFALNQRATSRDRQRDECAKALQAVLRWIEMPYRVHRARILDEPSDAQLVARFHELQEELAFHESWLAVADKRLGDSYRRMLTAAKFGAASHLQTAWAVQTSNGNPMNLGNLYPVDISAEREAYADEVRRHLEWLGLREHLPLIRRKRGS